MEWKNTKKILDDFGKQFIEAYRQGLINKEANASGELNNSLNYDIAIEDRHISLSIELAEYWKYLEYGCKGKEDSYPEAYYNAHFPPVAAIEEWIKVKPVLPQPHNGKLPTTRQLAYMIARSISLHGVEPRFIFRDAGESVWEQLKDALADAISRDVEDNVNEIFKVFDFRVK